MTESVSTIETNRIPEKVDEVVDVYLKLIEIDCQTYWNRPKYVNLSFYVSLYFCT
jgi:hypothetical protein